MRFALLFLVACVPAKSPGGACPTGTTPEVERDSDVGWGEVERTDGCVWTDGTFHGPATELVAGGTKLVGNYADGKRVGEWTQLDATTGARIGGFTLDARGSGVEVIRDSAGHSRSGNVVRGQRDGDFVFRDADGSTIATETWSHGAWVRRRGEVPWDPPMFDPGDICTPDAGDGCP